MTKSDDAEISAATPTDQHQVQRSSFESQESLLLTRTRSPEPAFAENVIVQAVSHDTIESRTENGETNIAKPWPNSARYFVFLCAFFTSLSFGTTQVPLLYVFRLMTCDAYYQDHPPTDPELVSGFAGIAVEADRCALPAIDSSTALSYSLLGASTTIFGTINLFLTGSLIKKIGVKSTLLLQVFFPAARLFIQNLGVEFGGKVGIIIIQVSQVICIIGGPSGYMLALNTYTTELVEHEGRTAALGRLTGSMMFGSALGFLLGGVVAEKFGIKAPFRLTFFLFLGSCIFAILALPYIKPCEKASESSSKKSFLRRFADPIAVFAPQKFIGSDSIVRAEYGTLLLACGVFLGILATGYLPTLLQLYSTNVFNFGTQENGFLIFMYSMLRGAFLVFVFPQLIAIGRRMTARKGSEAERQPLLESQIQKASIKEEQMFTFDLTYTRFSLIADGLLTLACSFIHKGWQMYLMAGILPFAAGTGAAAKGTILQMIGSNASSAARTDALAGVSLLENAARLSTTFVFGIVYAGFASIGRTELVFACNAFIALLGFGVLLFARFPLEGSHRIEEVENNDVEE